MKDVINTNMPPPVLKNKGYTEEMTDVQKETALYIFNCEWM